MHSSSPWTVGLTLGFLSVVPSATAGTPDDGDACSEARDVLNVLARGSIGEAWTIVEDDLFPDFIAIGDPEDEEFAACRDILFDKLTKVVSRTDDDRIVARVLAEIDLGDASPLLPVVRAALRHASPEVRRHMLRAVTAAPDPLLIPEIEARFDLEHDARTRRELIRALAASGSRRYLPELRTLARSDDAPLRRVAIQALLDLPDAASVPILVELASSLPDDDFEHADRIVSTLASWDDQPGVDEGLVRIGLTARAEIAAAAIRAFERRGVSALGALALIANGRERDGDASLAGQAEAAIEFLRNITSEDSVSITSSCGAIGRKWRDMPLAFSDGEESSDRPVMLVNPSDGTETARCWDAPGFMWPEQIRPRVAAGTVLKIFDEFRWSGTRWLAVVSVEHLCWMREADLVGDVHERALPDATAASYEFDLQIDEMNSWAAGTLERRGWLRVLSADDSVAALHLELLEPAREDIVSLIAIRRRTLGPSLAAAIDQWLYRHASPWRDEELGQAIPTKDPRWAEPEDEDQ